MPKEKPNNLTKNLLYLAAFAIPFYFFRFSYGIIKGNTWEIVILLAMISWLITNKKPKRLRFGSFWAGLFIIFSLTAVFYSPDKAAAIGIVKGWFLLPAIFYWLVINVLEREDYPKLSLALFVSLLIVSVWAIAQKMGFSGLFFYQKIEAASFAQYLNPQRSFGPFESPNYLAMFLVPAMCLAAPGINLIKTATGRIVYIALYLLPVLSVLFSASRGGELALAVVLIMSSALYLRRRSIGQLSFGRFSLSALVLMGAIYAIFHNQIITAKDNARLEIYRFAWRLIKEHPFSGIGLGSFHDKIDQLSLGQTTFRENVLPYALHPHNLYFSLWLSLGFLGLVAFIILIIDFIKRLKSSADLISLAGYLALVAILIHGIVDTTYFKNDLAALFWLACASVFMVKQNANSSK